MEAGTIWKALLLEAGVSGASPSWESDLAAIRADVLPVLREKFPILSRWVESFDWIQSVGRGDVVAVMSLHTGAVTEHTCIARREELRDEAGLLWNWGWVLAHQHPTRKGELEETRVDASGALLSARGEPIMRVLVRPAISPEEHARVVAQWHSAIDLRGRLPVVTVPVVQTDLDVSAFEREVAAILEVPEVE